MKLLIKFEIVWKRIVPIYGEFMKNKVQIGTYNINISFMRAVMTYIS